jgi:hypothetical protein
MSQTKYSNFSSDIPSLFQDNQQATDKLLSILEVFMRHIRFGNGKRIKSKGYSLKSLFCGLFMQPFLSILTVFALQKSGLSTFCDAKKDAYYTTLRNEYIDWRSILHQFTLFFMSKTQNDTPMTNYLIIDDTDYEKTGKHIEGVNYIFNHVTKRYVLGFKLLCLTLFDGKSHIPLDFSVHKEDCSTKLDASNQFKKSRKVNSSGYQRYSELATTKIESSKKMILAAVKSGVSARYVLADSWFICDELLKCIKSITKCVMDIVGMVKMDERKYVTEYSTCEQNIHMLIKIRQDCEQYCKKYKMHYNKIKANYKGTNVVLWVIRSRNGSERKVILSTDTKMNFTKVIDTYKIRWSIEVMFKELKQYFKLNHCQSRDFDAHIASISITLMQHIAMTLVLRYEKYVTMGGLFRNIVKACAYSAVVIEIRDIIRHVVQELGEIINCSFFCIIEQILSDKITILHFENVNMRQ